MKRCRSLFVFFAVALGMFSARQAQAHLGPPFPVLLDQKIPGYAATIWSNPDVTRGVLFVTLEPLAKQEQPAVSGVDFWIEPTDAHTARKNYHATAESTRGVLRFATEPDFDAVGPWRVGAEIHLANGADFPLATQVEATPPGVGTWGVLLFLFPFILFGGLWVLILIRRAKRNAPVNTSSKTPTFSSTLPSENGDQDTRA